MQAKSHTVIEVNYGALEREVKKAYSHEWSFVADQECHNDTYHLFNGIDGADIDRNDLYNLNKFIMIGQGQYLARILLNDLVRTGRIEPGDYLVHVSW